MKNGFLRTGGAVVVLDGYQLTAGRTLGQDVMEAGRPVIASVGGFVMGASRTEGAPKTSNAKEKSSTELAPPPKGGLETLDGTWRITWDRANFGTELAAVIVAYVGNTPLYDSVAPHS